MPTTAAIYRQTSNTQCCLPCLTLRFGTLQQTFHICTALALCNSTCSKLCVIRGIRITAGSSELTWSALVQTRPHGPWVYRSDCALGIHPQGCPRTCAQLYRALHHFHTLKMLCQVLPSQPSSVSISIPQFSLLNAIENLCIAIVSDHMYTSDKHRCCWPGLQQHGICIPCLQSPPTHQNCCWSLSILSAQATVM